MQSCSEHSKQKYWGRRFTEKSQTCNLANFIMGPSLFHLHSLTRGSFVIPEISSLPPVVSPTGDSSLPGREIPPHAPTHGGLAGSKNRANPGQGHIQFCISAGLKHVPCTGHSSPAWQCPAQQGCHCSWAAGPSWQARGCPPPPGPYTRFPS